MRPQPGHAADDRGPGGEPCIGADLGIDGAIVSSELGFHHPADRPLRLFDGRGCRCAPHCPSWTVTLTSWRRAVTN